MTFRQRILAWLLWKYERFEDLEDARFGVIEHPELLLTTGLLRDYWYTRNAREGEWESS